MSIGECRALSKPRDRILLMARSLFRKHGIKGVGVDAIAEAADTNKMTLYRHFGSKNELVAACLAEVGREADALWEEFTRAHPDDPLAQVRAWVHAGAACVLDSRGCDMANAAIELADDDHPGRRIIEDFKRSQRNRLVDLCRAARIEQADLLADALCLLIEGARVCRQSSGASGPSAHFIEVSEAVIAAFAKTTAAPDKVRAATTA